MFRLSKYRKNTRFNSCEKNKFKLVNRFFSDCRGNFAVMGALLLPALVLGAAVAVDYSSIYSAKSDLQQIADSAALAAAREMVLINKTAASTNTVATNYVLANSYGKKTRFGFGIDVDTVVDIENNFLTVNLSAKRKNAFGNFLQPEYTTVKVSAKAKALAGTNICAIGLDELKKDTIIMESNAALVANQCAIYSNSDDAKSIHLKSNSSMQADMVCSAGGVSIDKASLSSTPITDCPPIDDPFADKVSLPVGACDFNDTDLKDQTVTLSPGTYCGGIKVDGNSIVEFLPGNYIIKDGMLELKGNTVASGNYVGFYFTGVDSRMKLDKGTTIDFVAPKNGPMVGMLFFQDPNAPPLPPKGGTTDDGKFEIKSDDARNLLGTIYLPRGILKVETDNKVADESAFTVVIAKRMEFKGNSKLVLNSDYSATDVPVPDGIAGQNAKVYLAK